MRGNKLEAIYICLFRLAAHKDSQQTNFPAQQVYCYQINIFKVGKYIFYVVL